MLRNLFRSNSGANTLETNVAATVTAASDGSTQIVDVREPDEWAAGHIAGAIHIPLGHLQRQHQKLDPTRPVITVCRSGNRSLVAVRMLNGAGFADVKSLAGGMIAWTAAGQKARR